MTLNSLNNQLFAKEILSQEILHLKSLIENNKSLLNLHKDQM
jgi:hypothetical protein